MKGESSCQVNLTRPIIGAPGAPIAVMKAKVGISLDQELLDALDRQAESLADLALNRSEIVNSIVKEFFRCGNGSKTKARKLVTKDRSERLGRINISGEGSHG